MKTIHIDGSRGEGGGQVLRSSLTLSLITGLPFVMENIRANRPRPGLMRQHLTAVEAAMAVGNCHNGDAKIGSRSLRFTPQKLKGGIHKFTVGSAGSANLVLQTVLPALLLAKEPSNLTLRGGTHNQMAPPFDFLDRVYLPILRKMGAKLETSFKRHGFYPAGGGEFKLEINPIERFAPLNITERGNPVAKTARILISKLPFDIAEREQAAVIQKTGWDANNVKIEKVEDSPGPGNVVILEFESENVTEMFTGFGEIGISAEKVASIAIEQYRRYLAAEVPIGEHLANQIMLPLGIAAHFGAGRSEFRTLRLSDHSQTQIEILQKFLNIKIETRVNSRDDITVICLSE